MADIIDEAQDREAQRLQESLAGRARLTSRSASHCQDCGDEIREQRREIPGVIRCLECQCDHEHREART